ncbi:hypothetical protein J5N97_012753 [Dioscorea zingiberensis]|uniref:Uncharacterized protein n=1 Tax=Dioscorea zingiberensis TaxID=325984 RepID=A0A9D5CQT5_9LILI|nr:hypothetical protein J5N97_012753 [Dioscorea zingiberensis]
MIIVSTVHVESRRARRRRFHKTVATRRDKCKTYSVKEDDLLVRWEESGGGRRNQSGPLKSGGAGKHCNSARKNEDDRRGLIPQSHVEIKVERREILNAAVEAHLTWRSSPEGNLKTGQQRFAAAAESHCATGENLFDAPVAGNYPNSGRQTARKPGFSREIDTQQGGDLSRAESHNGNRKRGPGTPPPLDVEEQHHASLSMDSILMMEREELWRCSVATVTKLLKGLGGSLKVTAAVAELFEHGLDWKSELYEDGKILIHCPSEAIARELERRSEITFPDFIVRFEPWSLDTDPSEKINDEIRWIVGKGMPTFGRRIDTIARVLKPIGELIHLAVHAPLYIGQFRAMVRIRRGRRFPAIIHSTILRRRYRVRVELEPGQSPLPWLSALETKGDEGERDSATDERGMKREATHSPKWPADRGNRR